MAAREHKPEQGCFGEERRRSQDECLSLKLVKQSRETVNKPGFRTSLAASQSRDAVKAMACSKQLQTTQPGLDLSTKPSNGDHL